MTNPSLYRRDICAVITAYNPDDGFKARVSLAAQQMSALLIVDNGSRPDRLAIINAASTIPNVSLLRNDINRGIAVALNLGARWAKEEGYSGVIFFDQDSLVTEQVLPTLIEVWNQFKPSDHVALIGSNFINIQSHKCFAEVTSTASDAWRDTDIVLTSGSLISLDSFQDIGPFREEFFIDGVELDYCFRAKCKGYRLIQSLRPTMKHSAGQPTSHHFLGKTVWTINHVPQRCYYMTRNSIILIKEYAFNHTKWALFCIIQLAKWAIKLICFEDYRIAKLRSIGLGIVHGITNTYTNPSL